MESRGTKTIHLARRRIHRSAVIVVAAAALGAGLRVSSIRAATLRGTIHPPVFPNNQPASKPSSERFTRIVAVDRAKADVLVVSRVASGAHIHGGTISAKGKFVIRNLKRGHRYDLIVLLGKQRWEGVDMNYYRLVMPTRACDKNDLKQIRTIVTKVPRFFNRCRALWIAADHHHATVLVEMRRTTPFYDQAAGQTIYRVELWYFQNYSGGWSKVPNTEKVETRWRGQIANIPKVWQYVPQLGDIRIPSKGKAKPFALTLPPPSPRHGLVHGVGK